MKITWSWTSFTKHAATDATNNYSNNSSAHKLAATISCNIDHITYY